MQDQVNTFQWVSVSQETRNKLREIFKIPKSKYAEVVNDHMGRSTMISDGTTNVDLESLTAEKMIDFVGSAAVNESMYDLFKRVVQKIEAPEVPPEVKSVPETKFVEVKESVKPDSTVVNGELKCEKCDFTSASKFAMRMHYGKKHK